MSKEIDMLEELLSITEHFVDKMPKGERGKWQEISAKTADLRLSRNRKRKRYCVRVVQTHTPEGKEMYEGDNLGAFVECLRYAGLVTVHETDPHGLTSLCFDIHAPNGIGDTKMWAEMNSKRMQSFGYNAVAAPSTRV